MSLAILGLGTAVPEGYVSQHEALAAARVMGGPALQESTWLESIYAHSGIDKRYQVHGRAVLADLLEGRHDTGSPFVPHDNGWSPPSTATRMSMYTREAPALAVEAAQKAVQCAGIDASEITHVVTVSCTGFVAPGTDLALFQQLRLRPTVVRTNVGFMGCHGAINGLRVAQAFAESHVNSVVLLVAVETCSLHYHYSPEPDKCIANALFADGAAAVIGRSVTADWQVVATGSCLLPDSAQAMTWSIGDQGFAMTLSRQIPRHISQQLRPWLAEWLKEHGLTIEDVPTWAIHPGGPKILDAAQAALGLHPDLTATSRAVFSEYGNMSSPTVLFILKRLMEQNAPRPCVMLGFGPGLVAEAALVR